MVVDSDIEDIEFILDNLLDEGYYDIDPIAQPLIDMHSRLQDKLFYQEASKAAFDPDYVNGNANRLGKG